MLVYSKYYDSSAGSRFLISSETHPLNPGLNHSTWKHQKNQKNTSVCRKKAGDSKSG